MKAITIKQPWASLIINGYKKYEFRTWKTNYRGKVLIHAGLSIEKENIERFKHLNLNYDFGCIIGEAEIVDCIFVDDKFKEELIKIDNEVYKNSSGYGFKLENIVKYEEPIYCKGKLSFWEYDLEN